MQVVVAWQLFWQHCEWYAVCSWQGRCSYACLSCIHKPPCWCQPWRWHYHSKCKAVLLANAVWCQLCIQRSKMFTSVQTHRGEDYAWLSEVHKWFSLELQHLEHVVLKGHIIKKKNSALYSWWVSWCFKPRHLAQYQGCKETYFLLQFCLWLIQVTQTCGRPFTYGKWQQLRWNCTGIRMYSSDDDWKLLWMNITAAISWNGEWSCLHPLYE